MRKILLAPLFLLLLVPLANRAAAQSRRSQFHDQSPPTRTVEAVFFDAYARLEVKVVSGQAWPWDRQADPKRTYFVTGHTVHRGDSRQDPPELFRQLADGLDDLYMIQIDPNGLLTLTFQVKIKDPLKLKAKVAKLLTPPGQKLAMLWSDCASPKCGY